MYKRPFSCRLLPILVLLALRFQHGESRGGQADDLVSNVLHGIFSGCMTLISFQMFRIALYIYVCIYIMYIYMYVDVILDNNALCMLWHDSRGKKNRLHTQCTDTQSILLLIHPHGILRRVATQNSLCDSMLDS